MKRVLAILAVCALPALCADSGTLPLLVKHLKTSKAYTVAMAEKMPADGYASKPNDKQMTFGEQFVHIAEANAYFLSIVTGTKPEISKPAKAEKDAVLKMLNASFDYVIDATAKLTPAQLEKLYDTPDGRMSGVEAIMFALDHTTHHRGQCIVYLRVKDIAPADYQF